MGTGHHVTIRFLWLRLNALTFSRLFHFFFFLFFCFCFHWYFIACLPPYTAPLGVYLLFSSLFCLWEVVIVKPCFILLTLILFAACHVFYWGYLFIGTVLYVSLFYNVQFRLVNPFSFSLCFAWRAIRDEVAVWNMGSVKYSIAVLGYH